MYTIYVIKSTSKKFAYVGFTSDLTRRLHEHQSGFNRSTKPFRPFKLIYQENVSTSKEAREREKYLKSGRGREFIKSLNNG